MINVTRFHAFGNARRFPPPLEALETVSPVYELLLRQLVNDFVGSSIRSLVHQGKTRQVNDGRIVAAHMPHERSEVIVNVNAQLEEKVLVHPYKSESLPEEMSSLLEKVRIRAYELFEQRGREDGHALDDWLTAENELGVMSVADVEESSEEFRVHVSCAKFKADELMVYAEPQAISVEGKSSPTRLSTDELTIREHVLFGRYDLPKAIYPEKVSARLKQGVLEIVAKKMTAYKPARMPSGVSSSRRKTKRGKSAAA